MIEFVEIEVKIIRQTDKDILIECDGCKQVWIPWAQIEDHSEDFSDGYEGFMYISEWIFNKHSIL